MNSKTRKTLSGAVAAILIISGLFGDVRAQNDERSENGAVELTVGDGESLTGPQQLALVKNRTQNVRLITNRVQNMLDMARKDKDMLRIDCLDDKLTQIRVNLVGIEERTKSLELAAQVRDSMTSNQQFTILKIYFSKIDGLKAEAENCVGDIDILLGQTSTVMTVDDDITPSDPADNIPDDVFVNPDPYPPASGFL